MRFGIAAAGWTVLATSAIAFAPVDETGKRDQALSPADAAKWWEQASEKERTRELTIVFEVGSVSIPIGSQPRGTPWPIVLSSKTDEKDVGFNGFLANQIVRDIERLGIFNTGKYFSGRVVEVTGRLKAQERDKPTDKPAYQITVETLGKFKVVK